MGNSASHLPVWPDSDSGDPSGAGTTLTAPRVTARSYVMGPHGLGSLGAAGLGALKAPPTRGESSGPLGAAPLEPELLASPQHLLAAPSPLACVSGIPTKQW